MGDRNIIQGLMVERITSAYSSIRIHKKNLPLLKKSDISKPGVHLLDKSGQSTIEFVLTFILVIAFILFFFQLSMIFAFGNYVHYATFMSARAYMAAGGTEEDQRSRAKDVIVRMLKKSLGQSGVDKFPHIARGVGGGDPGGLNMNRPGQFNKGDPDFSWMEGVRYTFQGKLFLIPLGGLNRVDSSPVPGQGPANTVTLTSESWLGREPAEDECRDTMKGFFDNGC